MNKSMGLLEAMARLQKLESELHLERQRSRDAEEKLEAARIDADALQKAVDEACHRLSHPHRSMRGVFHARTLTSWFDRDVELGRQLRAAFNKSKGE